MKKLYLDFHIVQHLNLKDPGFIQTDKLPENHYTISKMQSLRNLQGREPKIITN